MYRLCISRPYLVPDFNITTDDQNLYRTLCIAYRPFIKQYNNSTAREKKEIAFYSDHTGYFLSLDNNTEKIPHDYGLQAIENYIYLSTVVEKSAFAIHGAVVSIGRDACILAGFTGAGKSTLSVYLSSRGFEYLSDDLAIIIKKDLMLIPFPRPLQLRQGGANILKKYGIEMDNCDIIKYGDMERIIFDTPPPSLNKYHIKGIYFINRTDDINNIFPMDRKQSYINLLKNQYVYTKPDKDLIGAVNGLLERGIYNLNYCSMEYVYEVLIEDKYNE